MKASAREVLEARNGVRTLGQKLEKSRINLNAQGAAEKKLAPRPMILLSQAAAFCLVLPVHFTVHSISSRETPDL